MTTALEGFGPEPVAVGRLCHDQACILEGHPCPFTGMRLWAETYRSVPRPLERVTRGSKSEH